MPPPPSPSSRLARPVPDAGGLTLGEFLAPEHVARGRLPSRHPAPPQPDLDRARRSPGRADDSSPWRLPLDGTWRFCLVDSPLSAPAGWTDPAHADGHDDGGRPRGSPPWRDITVPGCWTRQDAVVHRPDSGRWTPLGPDLPLYTNIVMPWRGDPPAVPDHDPTGLYRRRFRLPRGGRGRPPWRGTRARRRTVLHVGGAESLLAVWCNGTFVGTSTDSRLGAEFDLTDHLVAGDNLLALMVVRWSAGTWIEDQDHWFHAGLHRSVYLESRGDPGLADLAVDADLDPTSGRGRLAVTAHVPGTTPGWRVRVHLETRRGRAVVAPVEAPVATFPAGDPLTELSGAYSHPGPVARVEVDAGTVAPWTAERPHLYRVLVELVDPAGTTREVVVSRCGFRRVEVRDRRLLVNGRPLLVWGVNRHDHDPDTGKVLDADVLRDDLVAMKRHNVNAVRTAHYPNDPVLLDWCDELGLYVIDEANVESHARLRSLTDDERWHTAIVERVRRLVLRDRHHPSVIAWSLGNESGHGPAHDAAAAWVRAIDPTRLVHYEGALQERFDVNRGGGDARERHRTPTRRERLVTDLVCPMYTPVDAIVAWARWAERTGLDDRPLVLCEYAHAMGNSCGGLTDYADAFLAEPALAGGFVWDWRDQGLTARDDEGRVHWVHGAAFPHRVPDGRPAGPGPTVADGDPFADGDASFCINGLVGPDGLPHPQARELAWCARPVAVTREGRRLRITNRRHDRPLDDLKARWALRRDGGIVAQGELDVPALAPGASTTLAVPVGAGQLRRMARATGSPGSGGPGRPPELHLDVEWTLARATNWAPRGHLCAWDQVDLTDLALTDLAVAPPASPARRTTDGATVGADIGTGPGVIRLTGGATSLDLDPTSGALTGIHRRGRLLVHGDITADLWRAPTSNDGVSEGWMAAVAGVRRRWLAWGLDRLETSVDEVATRRHRDRVVLARRRRLVGADGTAAVHTQRLTLDAAGTVTASEALDVPSAWADLPRVGVRFLVPGELDRLVWFGPGPDETYPDRRGAARVGVWRSTVADQYHPFVVPQEHGAHVDTRWLALLDRRRRGLRIDALGGRRGDRRGATAGLEHLVATARPHTDAELTAARTTAELAAAADGRPPVAEVHLDAAVRGLGTAACGPDTAPRHRVGPGRWRWSWRLVAVEATPP